MVGHVNISTVTGFETFDDASAKVHVFWCPQGQARAQQPGTESPAAPAEIECHLNQAAKPSDPPHPSGVMKGPSMRDTPQARIELTQWYVSSYGVPEGTVLKMFGARSTKWNERRLTASIYIRVRERAALRRIRMGLTNNELSVRTHAELTGRFDVMSVEEVKALGVSVLGIYERFADPLWYGALFELVEIEPEEAPRTVVESTEVEVGEGETKQVRRVVRRRVLDI